MGHSPTIIQRAVILLATAALLISNRAAESGCAGVLDPSFAPPQIFPTAIAADSDAVVVGIPGAFIRLRNNGELDLDFTATLNSTDPYAYSQITVIKNDGQNRWLIGGDFAVVNTSPRPGIARILANGKVDDTFLSSVEPPLTNTAIRAIVPLPDGNILVAGYPNTTNTPQGFVTRLGANGAFDPAFLSTAIADNAVHAIAVQPDGKILVGGAFTNFAGQPRNQLCRLLPDGSLDESFRPDRLLPLVSGITLVEDNKFLAYWSGRLNPAYLDPSANLPTHALIRFNSDGSTDAILDNGATFVSNVALQPDGKYLLGGRFRSNNQLYDYYKRIFPSGEVDATFRPSIGHGNVPYENGADSLVELDSQNRILVGGPFTVVNGVPRTLARLLNDTNACVPTFAFSTNRFQFVETNGIVSVPIFRTGDLDSTVSVQVASSYISVAPLVPPRTDLVFNPGVAQQNLLIPLTNDNTLGFRQTFQIYLTNQSPNAVLGPDRIAQVSVLDASGLNFPGSVDPSFFVTLANRGSAPAGPIVIMPDQKLVIAQGFSFVNGVPSPPLARINTDGSLDTSFNYTATNRPGLIAAFGEKLYVVSPEGTRPLIRLLNNGSQDTSFTPPEVAFDSVYPLIRTLCVHDNGSVVIVGSFTNINGVPRSGVARIKADGSVDSTFEVVTPPGSSYQAVNVIHSLSDGTYLLGGVGRTNNGVLYPLLTHVSTTGSILQGFEIPDVPLDRDWNAWSISSMAHQSDGSIIVGGTFWRTDSSEDKYLLRFTPPGDLDPTFNPPSGSANQVFVQSDDKIIIAGGGATRLNKDGSRDPSFMMFEYAYSSTFAMDAENNLYMRGSFVHYAPYAAPGLIRIRTADYAGPGVIELVAPESVESDAGFVTLTVRRTVSTNGEAKVRVRTRDSGAIAGKDYDPIDVIVTFADGEGGEKQVQVAIIDHPGPLPYLAFEAYLTAESPDLALSYYGQRKTVVLQGSGKGFYLDPGFFGPFAYEDAGYTTATIYRFGDSSAPASVDLVIGAGGDAVPGVDYQPSVQTIEFAPFEYSTNVVIPLLNDNIFEPDKTLVVKLQNPSAGSILAAPSSSTITIHDTTDEFEVVRDTIYAVQEQGFVRVLVQPVPQYSSRNRDVTFSYKTEGGTAQPGVEYVTQQGQIIYPANSYLGAQEIRIPLLRNSVVGPDTTIQVTLTPLTDVKITNQTATIILRHPPAALSAGAADPSFHLSVFPRRLDALVEIGNYLYAWEYSDQPTTPSRVSRYFHNGTRDESFDLPFATGSPLIVTPNGQMLLTRYNSYAYTFLRLNSDGLIDQTFHPSLPPLSYAYQAVAEPDEKLIVAGFVQLSGYSQTVFVYRLNSDGSPDSSFARLQFEYRSNYPIMMVRQPDGRILLSAEFMNASGFPKTHLIRLMADGQIDASFVAPTSIQYPGAILPMPDGNIYVSGWFEDGPQSFNAVARLNYDGSFGSWLANDPLDQPLSLYSDNQGRLYLVRSDSITRILPNGEIDSSFTAPSFAVSGASIFVMHDSFLVASPQDGSFHRLYFDPPTALRPPQLLPNNRIAHTFNFPANTAYILEQTGDFQTWTEVVSGTSTDGYVHFETDAPAANQFYRVRSR